MTTNSFNYAYVLLSTMFGIDDLKEEDFEEIGLVGWNLIGNKRVRLYRAVLDVNCEDKSVELPCNCDEIEAVTKCGEDYLKYSNKSSWVNFEASFTENYISASHRGNHPLNLKGEFVKYILSGDKLYIDSAVDKVNILYKGTELDENGLPKISDREALAIATYVAYIILNKKAMVTLNGNLFLISSILKADWEKKCDLARVGDDKFSQNLMDDILDAQTSWSRKIHGISYKVFK